MKDSCRSLRTIGGTAIMMYMHIMKTKNIQAVVVVTGSIVSGHCLLI